MPIDTRFTDCLFEPEDLLEVRILPEAYSLFAKASELVGLEDKLAQANAAGQNIYIGANPRSRRGGKAADVALARSLFIDADNITVVEVREQIADAGLPEPTIMIYSGHGVHAYWRLREPMIDMKAWTAAQKALIKLVGSDPAIHDAPRIMRLPAFTNHKPPPAVCEVIDADPARRYALGMLIPPETAASPGDVGEHWLAKAMTRAQVGTRNDTGLWLACQLRDAGLTQSQAEPFMRSYAERQGGDYSVEEALASLDQAYSRAAREPAKGNGQQVVTVMETPDPAIIPFEDDGLPEVSPDVLPDWARQMAIELSAAKEVSPTMAALLELAVIAACVQRRYRLLVEGSYWEPLCLYAAPALESGERKTAIHHPIVKPAFMFQKTLRDEAKASQQAAAVQRKLMERQIRALEQDHLNADSGHQEVIAQQIIELTGRLPQIPADPQFVLDDWTEAALGVALINNRESLLVTSDEGGLFDNMSGRHSEVSEIDLFLKAHTGSPHTVNRVGRENLLLTRPLLSVAISPQPAVLAKLAAKPGFITRGLTARFLWALPQSRVGYRRLEPRSIALSTVEAYNENIIRLAGAGREHDGDPLTLELSAEAHAVWKAFERELEPRLAPDGDLRAVKPWASKLAGAVARIAAACHCAKLQDDARHNAVGEQQMLLAVEGGRQLIPHASAAHRLMGGMGTSTARAVVLQYEAAGWPAAAQTLTEWWRPVRSVVGETSSDFRLVADALVDHGYLIPTDSPQKTGRPGVYFRANRALHR